jgi:hypothetical protein
MVWLLRVAIQSITLQVLALIQHAFLNDRHSRMCQFVHKIRFSLTSSSMAGGYYKCSLFWQGRVLLMGNVVGHLSLLIHQEILVSSLVMSSNTTIGSCLLQLGKVVISIFVGHRTYLTGVIS